MNKKEQLLEQFESYYKKSINVIKRKKLEELEDEDKAEKFVYRLGDLQYELKDATYDILLPSKEIEVNEEEDEVEEYQYKTFDEFVSLVKISFAKSIRFIDDDSIVKIFSNKSCKSIVKEYYDEYLDDGDYIEETVGECVQNLRYFFDLENKTEYFYYIPYQTVAKRFYDGVCLSALFFKDGKWVKDAKLLRYFNEDMQYFEDPDDEDDEYEVFYNDDAIQKLTPEEACFLVNLSMLDGEEKENYKQAKYNEIYNRCLVACIELHRGQVDKAGKPYWTHPKRVADKCDDTFSKCIALLHDSVEDTLVTYKALRTKYGIPADILSVLRYLTHLEEDDYDEYLRKVAEKEVAIKVKMADLTDNMDLSRLEVVTQKDLDRVEKYKKAYGTLKAWLDEND